MADLWSDFTGAATNPTSWLSPYAAAGNVATNINQNGNSNFPIYGANAGARNADMEAGYAKGKQMFMDDPGMQQMLASRQDLAKGYNGNELGAEREAARSSVAGEQASAGRQLASKAARGGVGGARAAAMQGAQSEQFGKQAGDMENKMAMNNANMVRQGTNELQDFMMKQRFGQLSTGLGYGQLGVSDRNAAAQSQIAAEQPKQGLLGQVFGGLF